MKEIFRQKVIGDTPREEHNEMVSVIFFLFERTHFLFRFLISACYSKKMELNKHSKENQNESCVSAVARTFSK